MQKQLQLQQQVLNQKRQQAPAPPPPPLAPQYMQQPPPIQMPATLPKPPTAAEIRSEVKLGFDMMEAGAYSYLGFADRVLEKVLSVKM